MPEHENGSGARDSGAATPCMHSNGNHNTPSTPPNAVVDLASIPVSSPFVPTAAAATRDGKSAQMTLHQIENFCSDHLSPVPRDMERGDLDSLVQAFQSAAADARYTALCKLLNSLSERIGTQKQLAP